MTLHIYTGVVIEGEGKARTLGFPTINIPLTDGSISGIYAGRVECAGTAYSAAIYADPRRGILEAHLIDYTGPDIVGGVTMTLITKIRDDRMFDDDVALARAIADDVAAVRQLLA